MADKKIGIVLGVSGEQQSAQAIEQVAQRGASAFDRFQTTVSRAGNVAEFAEGKVKKLGRGVNDAAGAVQLISPLLGGLGGNFGALASTVGNVSDVFGTLSSLLLRNPIGLAAIALTAGVTAFAAYNAKAEEGTASTSKLAEAVTVAQGVLKELGQAAQKTSEEKLSQLKEQFAANIGEASQLSARVDELRGKLQAAQDPAGGLQQALAFLDFAKNANEAKFYKDELSKLEGQLKTLAAASVLLQNQIAKINFDNARSALQSFQDEIDPKAAIQRRYQETISALDEAVRTGQGGLNDVEGERLRGLAEKRRDAALAALNPKPTGGGGKAEIDPLIGQFERLRAMLDPVGAAERDLANATLVLEQAQKAGLITGEELVTLKERLADKAYEASEAGRAEAAAIGEGVAAAERAITPLEVYERQLLNIQKALEAGKLSEEQAARARDKVKDELEQANGEGKAAAKTARELGLAFSSAFEDAIVGGKGFREVVRGLGQDLLRVFIRRQLTEPLLEFFSVASKGGSGSAASAGGGILGSIFGGFGGLFGGSSAAGSPAGDGGGIMGGSDDFLSSLWPFAGGGIMTSAGPLPLHTYARGGVADRPQLALFGEGRRPEAFVPLPDGRTIPVTMRGGGGGTVINIDARGAQHGVETKIRQVVLGELLPTLNDSAARDVERRANRGGSFAKTVGRRRGR